MRLTKKKAIELCIEFWTWCTKTGKRKEEWPDWEKYGEIADYCWFCEYSFQRRNVSKSEDKPICAFCPYYKAIGKKCYQSYFAKWDNARFPRTRKKYAKLFLEQIRKLK